MQYSNLYFSYFDHMLLQWPVLIINADKIPVDLYTQVFICSLIIPSLFLRSPGIWGQRVSHGEQGFYLYQRPSLVVHGCVRSGERYFEELADRP